MMRHYVSDGIARRCGSQIPANARIDVIKFLPHRRAVIEYNGKRYLTSALCCWKKPKEASADVTADAGSLELTKEGGK